MTDNLARFARLSAAAKERKERAEQEQWEHQCVEDEQRSRQSPDYLAGPPNGCHTCYAWRRTVFGDWAWGHGPAINPVTKPFEVFEGEGPEPCEYCTHACHGPDGLPLPVIAYA